MRLKEILVLGLTLVLYSCGGGSSDSNSGANQQPSLVLLGTNPLSINFKSQFSDPGASAVDPEDGDLSVTVSGSVDTHAVGQSFELTYSATDSSGNTATAVRTVIVAQNQEPSISLVGASVFDITVNDDFSAIDPGVQALDVEDGPLAVTTDYSRIVNSLIGEYSVTYSTEDEEGQAVTVTRLVRVNSDNVSVTDNKDSGGAVTLPDIVASRVECTSPCTIQFSAELANDSSSNSDNDWLNLAYYWDYDDSLADETFGVFERGANYFRTGNGHSRESDTTAMGAHTYICETGVCNYNVGLSVRNLSGDWAVAWKDITVRAESLTYAGDNTVCISTGNDFSGCPNGAIQQTALPTHGDFQDGHRYLYRAGEVYSDQTCIQYDLNGVTISSFGEGEKPAFNGRIHLGGSSNCQFFTDDSDINGFSNPYWISDITIHGIRVGQITLGMSFRNLDLFDLDMDYSAETIDNGGNVFFSGGNACSSSSNLSCGNVPLPYGLYMSQIVMKGSDNSSFLPVTNVGLWTTSGVGFVTMIDSTLRTAVEHNFRTEGANRIFVAHSDVLGNHTGTSLDKHGITLRSEGSLNQDGLNQNRRSNLDSNGDVDKSNVYDSRYMYVFDVYFGEPGSSTNNAARLSMTPTNGGQPEVVRFGVADNLVFNASSVNSYDVALAGHNLACFNNSDWQAPQECKDRGSTYTAVVALGEAFYNPALGTANNIQKPPVPLAPSLY